MKAVTFPQVPPYTGDRLRWPAGVPHLPRRAVLCTALATIAALSACGGGERDEEDHKDTQPVNCPQHPEQCK
jgi:hypothetical protein